MVEGLNVEDGDFLDEEIVEEVMRLLVFREMEETEEEEQADETILPSLLAVMSPPSKSAPSEESEESPVKGMDLIWLAR